MAQPPDFANIDLHLVKVLHTVVSEQSVSRAALRLGSGQPLVSAQLRRLRALTGDPLLVRAGTGLAPTDTALARWSAWWPRTIRPCGARAAGRQPATSTATTSPRRHCILARAA
jgi:hypothetical protein